MSLASLPAPGLLLGMPGRFPSWYPNQDKIFNPVADWYNSQARFLGMAVPTGCHAPGQGILMFDGSVKKVEDVVKGDLLMGPDSQPRLVRSLIQGCGSMYLIVPVKGKPFIVNSDHILSLISKSGTIVDVSVSEWLSWSQTHKNRYKLFRVGVDFPNKVKLPLDPYFLGIILGNGSIKSQIDYYLTRRKRVSNSVRNKLQIRSLGLDFVGAASKFIPDIYKTASRQDRLQLLAGLMDTDGSSANSSKSQQLANDVAFVARSCGLAAYVSSKFDGFSSWRYRVHISGDCSVIPCRRRPVTVRQQKKDVLHTGFSAVHLGIGDYYGFTLDGDGRYLLDDFTVTHNSGKTVLSVLAARLMGVRTIILTSTKGLEEQIISDFASIGAVAVHGQNNFHCKSVPLLRCDEGPCHEGMPCELRSLAEKGIEGGCEYYAQLRTALLSPIVVTNYAYYLAQTRFSSGLGNIGLLILDESHLAFSALENALTIYISRMEIESLGIRLLRPGEAEWTWTTWREWAEEAYPLAEEAAEKRADEVKAKRQKKEMIPSSLSRSLRSLKTLVRNLNLMRNATGDWVIQFTDHGWSFAPIWVNDYGSLLFREAPKVMLMSAILTHKTADSLGVPSEPENRPGSQFSRTSHRKIRQSIKFHMFACAIASDLIFSLDLSFHLRIRSEGL